MKKLKIFFIVIFFILLATPVVTFRTEENAVSEVDNRMLATNPVSAIREGEDATQAIENYVNDRIGLDVYKRQYSMCSRMSDRYTVFLSFQPELGQRDIRCRFRRKMMCSIQEER